MRRGGAPTAMRHLPTHQQAATRRPTATGRRAAGGRRGGRRSGTSQCSTSQDSGEAPAGAKLLGRAAALRTFMREHVDGEGGFLLGALAVSVSLLASRATAGGTFSKPQPSPPPTTLSSTVVGGTSREPKKTIIWTRITDNDSVGLLAGDRHAVARVIHNCFIYTMYIPM